MRKHMSKLAWSALLLGSLCTFGCGDDDDDFDASRYPIAVNDTYSVAGDGILLVDRPFGFLANDGNIGFDGGDVDDDVNVAITNPPRRGNLQLESNGAFTYVPLANQQGQTDSFIYVVSNDQGQSAATVTIFIGGNGTGSGVTSNVNVNTSNQPIYYFKK